MCTILSFTKQFYNDNKEAVHSRIRLDAHNNDNGCALFTIGRDEESPMLLRSMSVSPIIKALEIQMDNGAERAWLHMRYATTDYVGINGCHGFAAQDHIVMHNGCMSRAESYQYNVDSELIAVDVALHGVDQAIANICTHKDNFVNAFMINTLTGQFTVLRMHSGSLYSDGFGNYSTVAFGDFNQPVPVETRTDFTDAIVVPAPIMQWSPLTNSRHFTDWRAYGSDKWDFEQDDTADGGTGDLTWVTAIRKYRARVGRIFKSKFCAWST